VYTNEAVQYSELYSDLWPGLLFYKLFNFLQSSDRRSLVASPKKVAPLFNIRWICW